MQTPAIRSARFLALFLLGCLLLNYPFLAIFNIHAFVWGFPVLYAYLFGTWGILIVLIALAARAPAPPTGQMEKTSFTTR